MKKTISILLVVLLLLCGCSTHRAEATQLEPGKSYEVLIEEDYKITLELVSQTEEYLEILVSKEETNGYFNLELYNDTNSTQLSDLAFAYWDYSTFKHVVVNDSQTIEAISFGGGIKYGCPHVFVIESFEGSVSLKFYFTESIDADSKICMETKAIQDNRIAKVNSIGNDKADSIIQSIYLSIK